MTSLVYNHRTITHPAMPHRLGPAAVKVAVTVIGWLAVVFLGGWLAWWAATRTDAVPNALATIALGSILLLAWAGGTVLVWRRAWFAALAFAMAGVLPLTPEHALPQPDLLVAVSAALAVGSWLAGVASWVTERPRGPVEPDVQPVTHAQVPIPRQRCVVCREPSSRLLCAACAVALGADAARWLDQEPNVYPVMEHTDATEGPSHDA